MAPPQDIDRPLGTEACQTSNEPDTTALVQSFTAAEHSEAYNEHIMGQGHSSASSQHLLTQIVVLEGTVRSKNTQINELQNVIEKQNQVINDRTSAGLSSLAYSVSTTMPDDEVRLAFLKYWEGDFLDWCAEYSAKHISQVEDVKKDLAGRGLFHDAPPDEDEAWFDFGHPQASFVMLQAALSHSLCHAFLGSPFFLLSEAGARINLENLRCKLFSADAKKAASWQVQTMQLLEQASAGTSTSRDRARAFMNEFKLLLTDDADVEELMAVFDQFAELAMKLWKLGEPISVKDQQAMVPVGSEYLRYSSGFEWMLIDSAQAKKSPDVTEHHAVHTVTRPLIVSPRKGPDGLLQDVLWSPAFVWL